MISPLLKRLHDKQSFRRLFDTPDGQVVLRVLIKEGFIMESTFVSKDANETLLNEGSRRMVLSILKNAGVDSEKLLRMMEQIEQEKGREHD